MMLLSENSENNRAMLPLVLQERRTHALAVCDPSTGRYIVHGECDWLLRGEGVHLDAAQAALTPGTTERLSSDLLLVRFGNAVGRVEVPHLGKLDVRSGKWSEADFERMLGDLMTVASALPFAADAATALPYERSVASARPSVLYHAFVYLRHILSDVAPREERLLPALEAVLREPHRTFERVTITVPLERASRADDHTAVSLLSDPARLVPVAPGVGGGLPASLRGYLPTHIDERQTRATVDTPENRFVKAFLTTASSVIDGVRRVAMNQRRSTRGIGERTAARVLADCAMMERALLPYVRHPFWQEVSVLHQVPAASTVLQRRRGYRDVFRHHTRLRMAARVPLNDDTLGALLESKDIALLYELWCYFAVAGELTALLGPPATSGGPRSDPFQLTVEHDMAITWPDGTALLYNLRFSRSRSASRRSYSVPLRPDIALRIPSGLNRGLHLFDAKFRLERLRDLLGTETGMEEVGDSDEYNRTVVDEERHGTFKRADMYKMHTYRDALGAASVWILYPGSEFCLFRPNHVPVTDVALLGASISPDSRLSGVGALPMIPNQHGHATLRAVLERMLGKV